MGLSALEMLPPALALMAVLGGVAAQGPFKDTIVVTASAAPSEIGEVGRAVTVLDRQQIEQLPVGSFVDVLRFAPGLEVRARGEQGIQTDFSIRGATFAQTLVLVDGVPLNDPQSAHHNGDVPVPLDDIERIEILYGPASALHGADAFGGTLHVLTRRDRPRASARVGVGSFGSVDGSLSARLGGNRKALTLTAAAQRSDGFTDHRDHEALEGRVEAFLGRSTRMSLGYVDKEFGAKGFYGPAPSREWTSQSLLTFDHGLGFGPRTSGRIQAFLRLHSDRFVYDVEHPTLSDNRHESRSTGLSAKVHRRLRESSRLSFGVTLGADEIDSTNLGDADHAHVSAFAEARGYLGPLTLTPGLRATAYESFGSALSPSLAAAGAFSPRVRWRASGGHAFRVPTYTELRYHDPNHAARPDLEPERAWGADAGLDILGPRGWSGSTTVFGRWDASVIDWVRATPEERWHTANVRHVRSLGLEISARRRLGESGDVGVSYTYLDSRARQLDLLSKYLLDFARHSSGVQLHLGLPAGLALGQTACYRHYSDGRNAVVVNVRLSRGIGPVRVWADARNLLDSLTPEIRGVDVPGRAFTFGLELKTAARP